MNAKPADRELLHSTTAYPPNCSWASARVGDSSCAIAALRPQQRRSGSPSRNFRPCARWEPGCRSVTNASMATTFDGFTRATISHCNGVCRSDCEPQWVNLIAAEDLQGIDAVAPSRAIAAQVLQS